MISGHILPFQYVYVSDVLNTNTKEVFRPINKGHSLIFCDLLNRCLNREIVKIGNGYGVSCFRLIIRLTVQIHIRKLSLEFFFIS